MSHLLTASVLREILLYDPDTGEFSRRISTAAHRGKIGDPVGTLSDQGYLMISVKSKQYRAHRLAFLYMTGEWPSAQVDHVNGIRIDNRWANLRDVPQPINQQNRRHPNRNSSTGVLGVSWISREQKYGVRIWVGGKYKSFGQFDDLEKAKAVYLQKKRSLHPGCTI